MPGLHTATRTGLLAGAFCAAGALGCAGVERGPADPVEPPSSFSAAGESERPDRWWAALDDPRLDQAVDAALASNLELRTAWERLREAAAVADRTAAGLWPAVDASADARSTRPPEGEQSPEVYTVDLAASYEVDLWGRIRSRADADRLRARATAADFDAAALTVSAEAARAWAELVEARSQVALIDRQIRTNLTVLELLENRLGTGLVRSVDLLRQRQLVEATREERALAAERRSVVAHRLAVLQGRSPQEGPVGAAGPEEPEEVGGVLPALPPLPTLGVPLDLVRRRPDVRAAFLRLRAADEDVAAALSDRYPRLSVSASGATRSAAAGDLFQGWVRNLGANLLAPIFYGGELAAEVDRTEAVRQQRLFEYGQATLSAFEEVENALARELRRQDRLERIGAQIGLAEQAYEQLRVEYFNGAADYLDVLTALSEVQALGRSLLTAERQLLEARIGLYRALAGAIEPLEAP